MDKRVQVPEEVMRQIYPHIVEGIQVIRGILRYILLANLLHVLEKNALSGRIARALQFRDLRSEQKCDKMADAFEAHSFADQRGEVKEQVLQSTGIDIDNPDHVREEACTFADVGSVAELAVQRGIPEPYTREMCPSFVESINMVHGMLREVMSSPYLPDDYKSVLEACLDFYNAMEEVGMLDLQ
ncbi:hypothetical protein CAPTEDRAFT_189984 [Capitella teleta]|uniref:Uncharacterized protein n=1 Tax=Capitella teleta TaxID=283909 RepID=R7TXG2_CAPTE|nr:hypothetical protein CAPTEDRAFT_189984 [Capitella teleta]|eukprot:ELT98277.1 hypothetical protein CAPTEDRAFT_189984 [Capitella teleta]